ncbi:MAG: hypothetical protein P4L51_13900 [Puia sp.]|nr:hypothetical protein [Puia sp.]
MFKNYPLLRLAPLVFVLTGCYVHQAFYVSPFNGNSPGYASIPLKADSLRSATYMNAAYFLGAANDEGRDGVEAFHLEISRAHNLGFLQAWYGASLSLGGYRVGRWDSSYYNYPAPNNPALPPNGQNSYTGFHNPFDARTINQYAGNHFFGGTGMRGGINGVVTAGDREWRVLGVETSLEREFGDYLAFRKQLPDSAASFLVKSNFFGTVGLYTEWLGKTPHGDFGFRLATGWLLGSSYNHLNIYNNSSDTYLRYRYFNFTFHYTWTNYTAYLQTDAATKANGIHLGFNYRIGR